MEIPVQTQVECKDGLCGQSVCVLIDPTDEKVTHVVIEEDEAPHNEYLVPIELTSRSIEGTLVLSIDKAQLKTMDVIQTDKIYPREYARQLHIRRDRK